MRNVFLAFVFLSVSVVANAGKKDSVRWSPDQSWNPKSKYGKLYNKKTIEKVMGEIVSVEEIQPLTQMKSGIHLKLKTSKETVSVHLGPAWYVLNQGIVLSKGDMVTVKGSKIPFAKENAIVAAQIKKDDEIMQLRDKNGVPYWCAHCIPSSEKF